MGLNGSKTTGFNAKLTIVSRPQVLLPYARWFQERGALLLHLAADSEGLAAREMLVVTFELVNAAVKRRVFRNMLVQVTWRDMAGVNVVIPFTPLTFNGSDASSTCGFF